MLRCLGCGKVGTVMCPYCLELYRKTVERIGKLWGTMELHCASKHGKKI
jgi:hypothetical protein